MTIYKLMIIDQIYLNQQAYGEAKKTIEIPFIPKFGMKFRDNGIQTELIAPQETSNWIEGLPDLVYDCDEQCFKYCGASDYRDWNGSGKTVKKYVELLMSKGYSFEPYETEKSLDS